MHLSDHLNIEYVPSTIANIDWVLEIVNAKLKTNHSATSCMIVICALCIYCLHLYENNCLDSRILETNLKNEMVKKGISLY